MDVRYRILQDSPLLETSVEVAIVTVTSVYAGEELLQGSEKEGIQSIEQLTHDGTTCCFGDIHFCHVPSLGHRLGQLGTSM